MRRFPFVEIRGGPRERGRQFGEACRDQVRGYAAALMAVLVGEAELRALPEGEGAGSGSGDGMALTPEDLY